MLYELAVVVAVDSDVVDVVAAAAAVAAAGKTCDADSMLRLAR